MIAPAVHRQLQRSDILELIAAIGRADRRAAGEATAALERGEVDAVLDAPAAADAIRGHGGVPAPVSLLLLWYVPVRAELLGRRRTSIGLADFTATVPLAFMREPLDGPRAAGDLAADWMRSVEAVPRGTVARAEIASRCGARALWWTGCFPGHLQDRYGAGGRRLFLGLAAAMLQEAARSIAGKSPDLAELYLRVADDVVLLGDVLHAVAADYIGPEAHSSRGRIARYLARLSDTQAA